MNAMFGKAQVFTLCHSIRGSAYPRDDAKSGRDIRTERRAQQHFGFSQQRARPCAWRHHQMTMTFKIKAADLKRMEARLDTLSTERIRLGNAVGVFNEALVNARATLQTAVDDYNQKARDVRAEIENVYRELEKAYAERSDDWKDGEKGVAVKEWLDTLESFPGNIVDVSLDEFIDELELDDLLGEDPRDDFDDLDKEPSEA
jgi:hypothetical protein